MKDLIEQAFEQVDVLGPHVMEGHYDLVGPDDKVIYDWDVEIQPGWSVHMLMWPLESTRLASKGTQAGTSGVSKRSVGREELDESYDDVEGFDVREVASSARRLRRQQPRKSLLFNDPPPRIDELEDSESKGLDRSEDEVRSYLFNPHRAKKLFVPNEYVKSQEKD